MVDKAESIPRKICGKCIGEECMVFVSSEQPANPCQATTMVAVVENPNVIKTYTLSSMKLWVKDNEIPHE